MSDEIKTISRDAGNTSKGFTLQKLRTISLLLDELEKGQESDFVAAIEYSGDVYVAGEHFEYVEENKDYGSQNFSFASSAIKNTMVYFLDYWLGNDREAKIKFGIFATNDIAKEKNQGTVKDLNISLPEEKIIESLHKRDYSDPLTLIAAKLLILSEYKKQYQNNKYVTLEKSYYSVLEAFTDQDWKDFFGSITWIFSDDSLETLEKEILGKIAAVKFADQSALVLKAPYIRAELFYQLELRQTKTKTEERFLNRDRTENIFHRAISGDLHEGSYKYLNIDYSRIRNKTKDYLKELIVLKYFAISGLRQAPDLLKREVLLLDANIKVDSAAAQEYQSLEHQGIKGLFSNLVQSNKPIFLFGELGSGKSSMVAEYLLDVIENQSKIVPVFIPSSYLQQKNALKLADLKKAINSFVNEELQIEDHVFDLDTLFKTKKECILIFDGIDELELKVARQLIILLKGLKLENDFLRIIATGRPIELEGIIPSGWHMLSIVPLADGNISTILYREALNRGLSALQSEKDSRNRLSFLQSRPELHAISTTPLIICSIRDSLNAGISDKTLGDILYDALKRRLSWSSDDGKSDEYTDFAEAYPTNYTREPILANLAWQIFSSPNRAVGEDELNSIIASSIPEAVHNPKVAVQATKIFKNNFLEKSTGNTFSFISAPILECGVGLYFVDKLKEGHFSSISADHWRPISFALAIARKKGIGGDIEESVSGILKANLSWPRNFVLQGAILSAEFKSEKICVEYFELLDLLEFRPLRVEYQNDIICANAYASSMILAKEKGFNWLWDNYLNLKNPLHHYEGKLAADILTQYLLLQDFKIGATQKQHLESLIFPNLTFPSSFCYEVLPVLATITDKTLLPKQRFQLLAGNLSKPGLGGKSKEILLKEFQKSKDEVLDALETVGSRELDKDAKPGELWMEINTDRKISKGILGTLLKCVNYENFNDYKVRLASFIKEEDLRAFLKYCIVSKNEFAESAALYLFLDGDQDFKLIGSSLLKSIDWLDAKNYSIVERIEDLVKRQDPSDIVSIIHQVPYNNNLGIPPAFWRLFLAAIELSDSNYEQHFIKALRHLSLHTLTRYPEIRLAFSNVLRIKNHYQKAVREAIMGLDPKLRYLSASLLLTINPEDEYEALEVVIHGISNDSDMSEWETFCLGLRYTEETLQQLYSQLHHFHGISRIFALLLLKRNDQPLNPVETEELIKGLLLEGYFLDRQGYGMTSKYNIILSQPEYRDDVLEHVDSDNIKLAQRAADILYQYHISSVDESRKPKIFMLYCEKYQRAFLEFTIDPKTDLLNQSTADQLEIDADEFKRKYGKEPLLWLYCCALRNNSGFVELVKMMILKDGLSFKDEWDLIYEWLLNTARRFPALKKQIAEATGELFQIPAVNEANSDNFAWLKLMENEFASGSDFKPEQLSEFLPRRAEELYIALYFRGVYRIDLSQISPGRPKYMRVFAENKPEYIEEVTAVEVQRYLFSAEQIPADLNLRILDVLLFGNFSTEELNAMEAKGELGSYFSTVIKFCRGLAVNTALFSSSSEIGGLNISQRELIEFHRNILFRIYQILLSKEECQRDFIAGTAASLEDENDEHFVKHFQRLLHYGYTFKKEHVVRLFDFLDDTPYLLKQDLVSGISDYFAEGVKMKEKAFFIEHFKNFLRSNRSRFSKYQMDPQTNSLMWVVSLVVLSLEGKVSEEAKFGFLLGLQSCFLEKNSMNRYQKQQPDYYFQAGALLEATSSLLEKVAPDVIAEICRDGAQSNIPEVRATCYVLKAMSGIR